MPPSELPGPAVVFQTVAPLSAFSAHMTPDFWPAATRSPAFVGMSIAPCPKS
jgi:hypothetical protein